MLVQQQAIQDAQRELQELERTRQQMLATSSTVAGSRSNSGGGGTVPGLDEWETSALKKIFQSLEEAKDRYVQLFTGLSTLLLSPCAFTV